MEQSTDNRMGGLADVVVGFWGCVINDCAGVLAITLLEQEHN